MELEKQVCSLEIAKRLKELGVKQDSLVYWLNIQHIVHIKTKKNQWGMDEAEVDENGNVIIDKIDYRTEIGNPLAWNIDKDNCWSAFIVSEIAEMLPSSINEWGLKIYATSCVGQDKLLNKWHIQYADNGKALMECVSDLNLSNAMARMLIYLMENKLMKLTQ